jgi:hypothetical protein
MADEAGTAGSVVVEIGGNIAPFEAALNRARQLATAFDVSTSKGLSSSTTAAMTQVSAVAAQSTAALAKVSAPASAAAAQINRVAASSVAAASGLKNTSFQTANIAAQFQDIAVQLQSGQSPLIIALQQGTQLSAALGGGKGVKGTLGALASGFGALLSPVSLLTVGFIALGGIGVQALLAMMPKVKSLDDLLTEHTQLIGEIKQAWAGAADGLDAYDRKSQTLLAAQARTNASLLAAQSRQKNSSLLEQIGVTIAPDAVVGNQADYLVKQQFKPFADAIEDLRARIKAGKPDFDAFYAAIDKKVSADPGLRTLADQLEVATGDAYDLAQALGQAGAAAQTIGSDKYSKVIGDFAALTGNKKPDSNAQYGTDQAAAAAQSTAAYRLQLQAITALSPAQQGQVAYAQKLNELSSTSLSQARQIQEAEQARTLAVTQAQFAVGRADQARLLAANQNITSAKTDLSTIGLSISETQRLTFVRQQLASAESEAAQNGVSVSQAYIAKIKEIGAAYGEVQQKIAESKAMSDAVFATSQFGRTSSEQGIASTLRGIYGDDFQSHMDGAIAQQLRYNDALQQGQQLAQSFGSTLISDFSQGKGVVDTLTDAFGNLGQQLLQIALNQAIAQLFSSLLGGGFGSIAGGAAIPSGGFTPGLTGPKLFDVGGYTGNGGRLQPAGIVHRGEYVFDASSTARIGVPRLNALRGYADGGLVGANGNGNRAANQNIRDVHLHFAFDLSGAKPGVSSEMDQWARLQLPGIVRKIVNDPHAVG